MTIATVMDRLCCPNCRSTVPERNGRLVCEGCGRSYSIRDGVPDLMTAVVPDEPAWQQWRSHLEAFQTRRESRQQPTKTLADRLPKRGSFEQETFARFTGIQDGAVLDVGCGPGKFRHRLPSTVNYLGIDPIRLPEAAGFPFVQALAERIPFLDDTFDHVTVLAALDHFKDLPLFFAETRRVLKPHGRLHLLQQVHESASVVRVAAHKFKDWLEDKATGAHDHDAPHHMHDFAVSRLREALGESFDVIAESRYSPRWYVPRRLFLTLAPAGAA